MESARAPYVVDRVDAEGYEPDVIDGAQVGEFHQIEPVDEVDLDHTADAPSVRTSAGGLTLGLLVVLLKALAFMH